MSNSEGRPRDAPADTHSALERIPLAVPTIGGNAARYLQECVETNFVSSVGPFVERFEHEFATSVGARFAVAVSSGTAAIHLACRVLGVGPGDEVLVPSLTFVASANPVRYVGGSVILVDSERETANIDPAIVVNELVRRHARGLPQPKAIEVVHLLGHPAAIEPIVEAADRFGVGVIEDASEALGARWVGGRFDGRHVGTVGRVGCFSFNGNKLITTGGGGMLVTDEAELARRARSLSTQARLPGPAYDHDEVGYNYRMSNVAAALGVAQLEQLPELLGARRENARRYDEAIARMPALRPAPRAPWAESSFWLYTASLVDGVDGVDGADGADGADGVDGADGARITPRRTMNILDGLAIAQIEARPIWTPLHRTRLYADAPRLGGTVADAIFDATISLPSSSSLSRAQQDRVIARLCELVPTGAADP